MYCCHLTVMWKKKRTTKERKVFLFCDCKLRGPRDSVPFCSIGMKPKFLHHVKSGARICAVETRVEGSRYTFSFIYSVIFGRHFILVRILVGFGAYPRNPGAWEATFYTYCVIHSFFFLHDFEIQDQMWVLNTLNNPVLFRYEFSIRITWAPSSSSNNLIIRIK